MARQPLGERIVGGAFFAGLLSKAVEYAKNPDRLKDLCSKVLRNGACRPPPMPHASTAILRRKLAFP